MSERQGYAMEDMIARVLRWGTLASVAMVVAGTAVAFGVGAGWGLTPGGDAPAPGLGSILYGLASGSGADLVRAGLLLLIATPVLRVALTLLLFAARRERIWVALSALVLSVLVLSWFAGAAAA